MKSKINYSLYAILILFSTVLVFNAESINSAHMKYDHKLPWHGIHLEPDWVVLDFTVTNNKDTERNYVIETNFELISDSDYNHQRILHFNLDSLQSETEQIRIKLSQGHWKMNTMLYENSTDCCSIHGLEELFVVQPVQNYYNLLMVMGTIVIGGATTTALIFNLRFSKKQIIKLEEQISEQIKDRHLSQQPVLAFTLNFKNNRLNLDCTNIGNGPAKKIELLITTDGEQSLKSEVKVSRDGLAIKDHVTINNWQKPNIVGVPGGYDFDCTISGTYEDIFEITHTINEKIHFSGN